MKVGDRVKLVPKFGPHIGKEATIIKEYETIGPIKWFLVKLDDGRELRGPETDMQLIEP